MKHDSSPNPGSSAPSAGPRDQPAAHDTGDRRRQFSLWVTAAALLALLWFASGFALLLFAAVLAATCLRGAALAIAERSRFSVGPAIVLVLLLSLLAALLLGMLVLPGVQQQVQELADSFPQYVESWRSAVERSPWGSWLRDQIPDSSELSDFGGAVLERLGGAFSSVFNFLVNGFLITVIALYLAFEGPRYERGFTRFFPAPQRERVAGLLVKLAATLRSWILGQLFSMTVLGVCVYAGLSILGVPMALLMAVFTAMLTFIPNLGPVISVIPPIMLALTQSLWLALWVLLFYIVIQVLEGNLLTPMVMRKAISMPPALLLSAQVLLATILGFWGLVLAAPVSAVAMVLVEELHLKQMDQRT